MPPLALPAHLYLILPLPLDLTSCPCTPATLFACVLCLYLKHTHLFLPPSLFRLVSYLLLHLFLPFTCPLHRALFVVEKEAFMPMSYPKFALGPLFSCPCMSCMVERFDDVWCGFGVGHDMDSALSGLLYPYIHWKQTGSFSTAISLPSLWEALCMHAALFPCLLLPATLPTLNNSPCTPTMHLQPKAWQGNLSQTGRTWLEALFAHACSTCLAWACLSN